MDPGCGAAHAVFLLDAQVTDESPGPWEPRAAASGRSYATAAAAATATFTPRSPSREWPAGWFATP